MFAQEAPSDSATELILALVLAGFVLCLLLDIINYWRNR